ncbi:glycine betaine/L-proline transport ATP binding subunit [Fervidobacterium pennivorans DSM 9078]|uniref:Glycine betaine/L-proline transport ATP binding subunit n=1 Tax=Fervidobacterium pennivorans (strain DSM 9078 / Ven5) TaxID=771875 RepID=H9UCH2_FERPD|nr:betaine/proline/choline family ABC transporter ATP-binding protein [Fervidobacterium pennivorans]AFG35215.1 glycine betaine/L-proline transport ATP binding subunit [Fervidobacterium pennivorans DSM 9078]
MAIELIDLKKYYPDGTKAVDGLNLTIENNKLTILIGPSGCGKTTTLKMINRLIERTGEDIRFDGTSIDEIDPIQLRRSIGYVIQDVGLFPHMTVFENIAVVPRLLKWDEEKIRKRVNELLELVNLDPEIYRDRYPAQLSGGQKQRVGIARGLAADPDILLMDEPFGAIDPINREKLQDALLEIQDQLKKTIVFVTHDIREAIKLGDKIAILNQGKLVQYDDTEEILRNPKNEFVEELLGSDRVLRSLEITEVREYYKKDFNVIELSDNLKIKDVLEEMNKKNATYLFVVDKKGRFLGYVSKKFIEKVKEDRDLRKLIKQIETVRPSSNLLEAMSIMMSSGLSVVPVVNDKVQILGVLRLRDLLDVFESTGEDSI